MNPLDEGRHHLIAQKELFGRLLHNLRNTAVVNVADIGEQVVLYLEVQSADVPIDERIISHQNPTTMSTLIAVAFPAQHNEAMSRTDGVRD